jgi:hypothetical protein
VLLRMLASRGVSGQLVISVRPLDATIAAHAWVEVDDLPLLPPAPDQQRLVVL